MTVEIIKGFEVKLWLDDDIVGRASSVTCRLENSINSYFELGDRDAAETYEGLRKISGTLERAVINGMLLSKVMSKYTESGGKYTIASSDIINPATSVSDESISANDTESVFELAHQPVINGTVVIKRDSTAWGTEGVDYIVDYENGFIAFTSPPSSGNTWTIDYDYGRSYTMTFVMQVGDGTHQRTDVTVGGLLFDTHEITLNNNGDVVTESLDYKAKSISGISLGETSGV